MYFFWLRVNYVWLCRTLTFSLCYWTKSSYYVMTKSLNTRSNYYCGFFVCLFLQIIMTPVHWPPTTRAAGSIIIYIRNHFLSKSLQGVYNYPTLLMRKVLGECTNFAEQCLNKKRGWKPKPSNLLCHYNIACIYLNFLNRVTKPIESLCSVPGTISARCYHSLN